MQSQIPNKSRRTGLLLVLMFLIADVSAMALASPSIDEPEMVIPQFADPILIDGLPPLMCGDELCERPTRLLERDGRSASEEYGWWQAYGPDLDWNGLDDRLQRVIAGMESISPTSIVGDDGRKTVAIIVDYAWHPSQEELDALVAVLEQHGWVGEEGGAWLQTLDSIDSIVVDKVPVSALIDI